MQSSINRTLVELKLNAAMGGGDYPLSINRTLVELKRMTVSICFYEGCSYQSYLSGIKTVYILFISYPLHSINRTLVELKLKKIGGIPAR